MCSLKIEYISLVAHMVKCLPTMQETWVRSLGWENSLRRKWQPTPVFLPGKSHGWRILLGYSPWGCKESDMTELHSFILSPYYGMSYDPHLPSKSWFQILIPSVYLEIEPLKRPLRLNHCRW